MSKETGGQGMIPSEWGKAVCMIKWNDTVFVAFENAIGYLDRSYPYNLNFVKFEEGKDEKLHKHKH